MNNTELLPCPFCGNTEPKLVPQGNAPEAFVYCGKCDLAANLTETAIKKWNTRASTLVPVERIKGLDELREALAQYGYIADQEDSQLSSSEEWYPVDEFKMRSIVRAARAQLKLQGG